MMIPLIGLIIGLIIGLLLNVPIPQAYGMYIAVVVISAFTSLTATIGDSLENIYNNKLVVLSFLGNTLIAVVLTALGQQINIPLNYVVYFGLGTQIFKNLNRIWRQLIIIVEEKKKKVNKK
ncbi:MAG: DUF1290 domain-containing protein [Saccharofermentanales bacterium]